MQNNFSTSFNRETIHQLRYDFLDMSYHFLVIEENDIQQFKNAGYERILDDVYRCITLIDMFKDGEIKTKDDMDAARDFITNLHQLVSPMIDKNELHGERYNQYIKDMEKS